MKRTLSIISLIALGFLLLSSTFAQEITPDQSDDLLTGFADGLGLDSDVTDEGNVEGKNLMDAINLLEGNSQKDAIDGLKILGEIMDRLPGLVDNIEGNDGADDYFLNELEEMAKDLENIDAYEEGKNSTDIVVRNVSITNKINEAAAQLKASDFYEAGYLIGEAFSNVYTATTPPAGKEVLDDATAKAQEWTPGPMPEHLSGYSSIDAIAKNTLGIPDQIAKNLTKTRRRMRRAGTLPVSKFRQSDFPESFDARQEWPNCVHAIRMQGQCGSCWAFGGTNAFADRVCIASGGKISKVLSPQYIVSCGTTEEGMGGCDGGDPFAEYQFFENKGIWQDSCLPYTSGKTKQNGECPSTCHDGSTPNVIYAKQGSTKLLIDAVNDVKHDLMTYGPMNALVDIFQDFYTYQKGIYSHVTGGNVGLHAVKLLGWGKDQNSGTEYWVYANSWGTNWGENGYFRVKFGDVQSNKWIYGAIPDIQRSVTNNNNGPDIPKENNTGYDYGNGGSPSGEDLGQPDPVPDNGQPADETVPNNGTDQPVPDNGQPANDSIPENITDGSQPVPENGTNNGDNFWSDNSSINNGDQPVPDNGQPANDPIPENGDNQPVPDNGQPTNEPLPDNGTGSDQPAPVPENEQPANESIPENSGDQPVPENITDNGNGQNWVDPSVLAPNSTVNGYNGAVVDDPMNQVGGDSLDNQGQTDIQPAEGSTRLRGRRKRCANGRTTQRKVSVQRKRVVQNRRNTQRKVSVQRLRTVQRTSTILTQTRFHRRSVEKKNVAQRKTSRRKPVRKTQPARSTGARAMRKIHP